MKVRDVVEFVHAEMVDFHERYLVWEEDLNYWRSSPDSEPRPPSVEHLIKVLAKDNPRLGTLLVELRTLKCGDRFVPKYSSNPGLEFMVISSLAASTAFVGVVNLDSGEVTYVYANTPVFPVLRKTR